MVRRSPTAGSQEERNVTRPGEAKLNHLFQPGRIGKFEVKNRIKYGACCVSNYNGRDGTITPRELARVRVIAGTGCGLITNQGASGMWVRSSMVSLALV